ncbi:MAG: hypothetical protein GY936_04245 [Ignavibacteriae bacterium]|nr:hypothetical protein [Ignavibacteriota bacterium]
MFNKTTQMQRTIMAVTAVIAGIMMMYIFPTQGMQTLKTALDQVMTRLIPFDPDFYPAVPILGATYGIWFVILWLGGALAIVIAKAVYEGKEWARGTMLGLTAVPAVAGMTMWIPWMVLVVSDYSTGPVAGIMPPPEWAGPVAPVLWTMVFGLIFYYIFLLMDQDTIKNKLIKVVPYTFLGIVAGMVFMNGQHGVRYFIFIPEYLEYTSSLTQLGNFYTNLDHYDAIGLVKTSQQQIDAGLLKHTTEAIYDPNTLTLLLGGFMNYAASYLMVLAIPFLAMKKKFGYYTVLFTALATALIGFDGYFVRSSFEWFVGGVMSLALFVMFLLPVFKNVFIEKEVTE